MAAKKQKTVAKPKSKAFLKSRIERINVLLGRLEGEFEKAVKRFITKGEKSSKELLKSFDDVVEWLKNGQIYALANGTKESVEAEIAKLKKETLDRVKDLEALATKTLFDEVRTELSSLLERLQTAPIVETVRTRAEKSRNHILEALNIPDQKQVDQMASRVTRLEKKIQSLSLKSDRTTKKAA